MIRVVNVKTDRYDVYIGRGGGRSGLHPSDYANPFRIGAPDPNGYPMTRETVIALFRRYAEARLSVEPDWLEPLRGEVLGCHCAPKACHGDVIVELLG